MNAWAHYRDLIVALRMGEYSQAVKHYQSCLRTECETAATCALTEALRQAPAPVPVAA